MIHDRTAARSLLAELRRHEFATEEVYVECIAKWLHDYRQENAPPVLLIEAEQQAALRRIAEIIAESSDITARVRIEAYRAGLSVRDE